MLIETLLSLCLVTKKKDCFQGIQREFIESVKNEDLSYYFSWADCMCTPSRWEGFGIVFIEALACEAVVVTSNIGPMNEFIKHKYNGLLVKDYENAEALAGMIKLACIDKELQKKIKNNARKSVEVFEKSNIDVLEVDYYKKVLNLKKNQEFSLPVFYRNKIIFNFLIRKLNFLFEYVLSKFLKLNFFKNFNKLHLLKEYIIKVEYFFPGFKSLIFLFYYKFISKKLSFSK